MSDTLTFQPTMDLISKLHSVCRQLVLPESNYTEVFLSRLCKVDDAILRAQPEKIAEVMSEYVKQISGAKYTIELVEPYRFGLVTRGGGPIVYLGLRDSETGSLTLFYLTDTDYGWDHATELSGEALAESKKKYDREQSQARFRSSGAAAADEFMQAVRTRLQQLIDQAVLSDSQRDDLDFYTWSRRIHDMDLTEIATICSICGFSFVSLMRLQ